MTKTSSSRFILPNAILSAGPRRRALPLNATLFISLDPQTDWVTEHLCAKTSKTFK